MLFLGKVKTITALFSSVAIVGYVSRQSAAISPALGDFVDTFLYTNSPRASVCDPTAGPGWVTEEGHWQRSDNACQSSQFVHRLRDTPKSNYADEFPSLVNKTMFFLGDSVGRQLWGQMCSEMSAPLQQLNPEDEMTHVDYSEASVCVQPDLNLTIIHFHQYGFANATDAETVGYLKKCFPGGPYDFETRVPHVWNTILAKYPTPDFVSINGGAWDFLYMFNRDIIEKRFHKSIPEADLHAFSAQLKSSIKFMKAFFPSSKMVFMEMHPLNNEDLPAKTAWGHGYFGSQIVAGEDSVLYPPLFTQRRLAQHAQTLRKAAEEEGVDSVDYWKLKDSFNDAEFWQPNDTVHPDVGPRVAMAEMMFEKLHQWVTYGV